MLREGFKFFRNGDDMRIAVASYSEGVRAIAAVEGEVRRLGLTLNGAKSRVVHMDTYTAQLEHVDEAKSQLRTMLHERRIEALRAGDLGELERAAEARGWLFEGWDTLDPDTMLALLADDAGPYEFLSIEERIERLREDVAPDDADVACTLFDATVSNAPNEQGGLPKEQFHERLQDALMTLAALRNPCAVDRCAALLRGFPPETELVVRYLESVGDRAPDQVVAQVMDAMDPSHYRHGWQVAWLLRPMTRFPRLVPDTMFERAEATAASASTDWFRRVACVQLLAAGGRLVEDLLRQVWRSAPLQFRPDLVEAALTAAGQGHEWAATFVTGCRGDRVLDVVLGHLGAPA